MKIKILMFFIVCFSLFSSAFVASSPSQGVNQNVESLSGQISNVFQHNSLVVNLTKLQRQLNENVAIQIKALKEQKNPALLFSILAGSFIYGVVHALGPGHGKSIISSWIISQQRRLRDVLFISVIGATFHALSATLIVGGTYAVLGRFAAVSTQKLNAYLQIAAAVLIIAIGLGILIRRFQGRYSILETTKPAMLGEKPLIVALSIGIVPCPVTSVILIFCLTMGLIWQGILLVISFAAGMGTSLVAISFLVLVLKEKLAVKKLSVFKDVAANILPIIGGCFLLLTGLAILYSLL